MKIKFDFRSLKFKLWGYFILFAATLIGLMWLLQIFFMNNYYEHMKIRYTDTVAKEIIQTFNNNIDDFDKFESKIIEMANKSDSYIKIQDDQGRLKIAERGVGSQQAALYASQAQLITEALKANKFANIIKVVKNDFSDAKMLVYACYLYKSMGDYLPSLGTNHDVILFIVTPLSPVRSTVSILHTQLEYITIIAMILALMAAFYMAAKISRPINDITESAAEMGKGHYGVKFQRGHYSEITELADTLTHASRELEKSDMYQKDLIANVSHDLKTPLTMIKSYAEMIKDLSGNDPHKRETHLNVIIDEADRLNTLVNDMLNMSRMQQRKISLDITNFELKSTVESLLASYDILAEKEGYKFRFLPCDPVTVSGDITKIKQVILNLINNAVKYCGTDKEIIITLKKSGRKIRCEITDHGEGIAPDEINHVWERYYKSSTHHVRSTEGTGLGLSIVKEILELHKCNYGVISKQGKGSTFWFELDPVKNKTGKKA